MTFKKLFIGLALTASGLLAQGAMAQDQGRENSTAKLAGVEVKNNQFVDSASGEIVHILPAHRGSGVTEMTNLHLAQAAAKQTGHHKKVLRALSDVTAAGAYSTQVAAGGKTEHHHHIDKSNHLLRNAATSRTVGESMDKGIAKPEELRGAAKHTVAVQYGVQPAQVGKSIVLAQKQVGNHVTGAPKAVFRDQAHLRQPIANNGEGA